VSDTAGLSVDRLHVGATDLGVEIVSDVSFEVPPSATLGIVGESGCGKTTVAMALLGFARPGTTITAGSVVVDGRDILSLSESDLRRARGRSISYVPQNPARALSPGMTVGRQLEEMLDSDIPAFERETALRSAWEGAQLPFDSEMLRRYPHQLSGGQQQRVAIAMALVCEPRVIVMDEPTTGLDVLTQDRLLEVIIGLREKRTVSIVYVSHDLGVVRNIVDAVAVMYGGRVVETGPVDDIFRDPAHPYTRRLLEAIPRVRSDTRVLRGIPGSAVEPWDRPPGCPFAPRCDIRVARCDVEMPPSEISRESADRRVSCWRATESVEAPRLHEPFVMPVTEPAGAPPLPILEVNDLVAAYRGRRLGIGKGRLPNIALRGVTFSLAAGSCLAVVGESGSGKTTLGRCLAGLHQPVSGQIQYAGRPLASLAQDRPPDVRRRIQLVFQDPDSSLNPHMPIVRIVRRPLRQFFELSHEDENARVSDLLEQVHLPLSVRDRMPRELSGGEKQRVAIARSLAADPELLICDEVTSALDVAVQASILELLTELRDAKALAMLFISHDLAVVRSISDRVLVLRGGEIVELAEREALFDAPSADYSRELLDAVPDLRVGDYPTWNEPGDTLRILDNRQT
jgi:peptide/nickel transport system ATP-binding protein